jgi:hypothetical protein
MRGWFNRALVAVAGVVVLGTAAAASGTADRSGLSAPTSRFANAIEIPVVPPASSSGPEDMLRNPLEEVSGTLALSDNLSLDSGFNVDVGGVLDRYVPSANAFYGLFYSPAALGSTYTSLSSGGTYFGLSARLADTFHFSFGQAMTVPGLNRYLLSSQTALGAMSGRLPFDPRNGVPHRGTRWRFGAGQFRHHHGAHYRSRRHGACGARWRLGDHGVLQRRLDPA